MAHLSEGILHRHHDLVAMTSHLSPTTCHPSPRAELQTLLGAIGSDIRKRMDGKRKKVEALTQSTVAANSKRSLDLFQRQQEERWCGGGGGGGAQAYAHLHYTAL